MPNILCFGDSNTFGTNPCGGRWSRDVRWPGALQQRLGPAYYIIEEGLGGRTTVIEDTLEPDKNGRRHLPVALRSHRPLDLVILMLGTNDMKHRFSLLPADLARGAAELGTLERWWRAIPTARPIRYRGSCLSARPTSAAASSKVPTQVSPHRRWRLQRSSRRSTVPSVRRGAGCIWTPRNTPSPVNGTACTWRRKAISRWRRPLSESSAESLNDFEKTLDSDAAS